jgi:hypothetical protein
MCLIFSLSSLSVTLSSCAMLSLSFFPFVPYSFCHPLILSFFLYLILIPLPFISILLSFLCLSYTCQSLRLSVCLSVCLSLSLSVCLFLSVCLSLCFSFSTCEGSIVQIRDTPHTYHFFAEWSLHVFAEDAQKLKQIDNQIISLTTGAKLRHLS